MDRTRRLRPRRASGPSSAPSSGPSGFWRRSGRRPASRPRLASRPSVRPPRRPASRCEQAAGPRCGWPRRRARVGSVRSSAPSRRRRAARTAPRTGRRRPRARAPSLRRDEVPPDPPALASSYRSGPWARTRSTVSTASRSWSTLKLSSSNRSARARKACRQQTAQPEDSPDEPTKHAGVGRGAHRRATCKTYFCPLVQKGATIANNVFSAWILRVLCDRLSMRW